jgi:hypothetical protein
MDLGCYFTLNIKSFWEIHADTGQKGLALENLKKAEGMFQEMGMDYWLGKTLEVLRRL